MATLPPLSDAELVDLRRRRNAGELDRQECCDALDRLLDEIERRRADELLAERQAQTARQILEAALHRRAK